MVGAPGRVALLLVAAVVAWAETPANMPFQVVQPTANHSSMVVVPDGLARLAQHSGNIALVSVVGPYHSGKSFLLNALLHHTQAFSIGSRTSPETMGIWLCRTNMTASDGSEVWLMDSEGFFGPGVDESYDAKVFTVASLVGAHLVYNSVKVIDQQAVDLLQMLVRRAQLFRTRSAATAGAEEVPEFLRGEGQFPPLTWVVEDFVQELPERLRDEGATGWLRTYLDESSTGVDADANATADSGAGRRHDLISKVYRDVRVHTLFLPATGRDQLRDLSRLSWNELTSEFREEIDDLRRHILRGLVARQSSGRPVTGPALATALQFMIRGLQQGMFHELPSLWGTWASQVADVSLADAEAWFASLLQKVDMGEDPLPIGAFNDRLEEAREASAAFYRSLLRDFEVAPQVGELRRRMEAHLVAVTPAYHERIRRWVAERIAASKLSFATLLASKALPMEPAALERQGASASEALRRNFSENYIAFSALNRSAQFGRTVRMPAFSPEPATQLGADLKAQLGMRSLENERAVQQLFKLAMAASDDAVTRTLQTSSEGLLSRAKLGELRKVAKERCWQVFEERLAAHSWASSVSHYKTSKALVQSEYYEARFVAFTAANEKRLQAHFSATLEHILAAYSANRSSVIMPAAESDIEAEQSRLASWAKEMLEGSAKDLSDTDAFTNARSHLNGVLKQGYEQMREKNVELWKAHSDEATRCALALNQEVMKKCGLLCLFSAVPWSHRATSRRHLSDCFARSAMASRMSMPLRAQVFEAWYNKDLGRDIQQVRTRFTMILGTAAALVAAMGWSCCCRSRQPPQYYNPTWSTPQERYYAPQQRPPVAWPPMEPPGCYGQAPPRRSFGFFRGGA